MRLDELRRRRDEITQLARSYGASNIRVFGSVVRGEDEYRSDIDLLVDLAPDRTLLDLGGLLMALHDLLGVEVDVSTEALLRDRVREHATRDAVPL